MTYTGKNMNLPGERVKNRLPEIISAIYAKSAAHPCQATGNPHPTPYFIVGNQNLSLFLSSISVNPYSVMRR